MKEVRRKVLLDLFASPLTLLPVVGGLTLLLAAWATRSAPLTFAGLAGILGGIGVFASRMIFGLERLTNRAYEYVLEQQQQQQIESLRALEGKLRKDRDPRTQNLLRQLWQLYKALEKDIKAGKIPTAAHGVMDSVDRMFHVCLGHLQQSYKLWQAAQRMTGRSQENTLRQREELIQEVEQSVSHLEQTIDELQTVSSKRSKSELARLREELDETIRVAKRVEQRTEELVENQKSYDPAEFE